MQRGAEAQLGGTSTASQQRADEVIGSLRQREADLMSQVNNLQQQLDTTMCRTMEVRRAPPFCVADCGIVALSTCEVSVMLGQGDSDAVATIRKHQQRINELTEQVRMRVWSPALRRRPSR